MTRSDHDLIEACLRGEARAWDDLVLRYDRLVISIARHFGLSATEADDMAQTVFMALLNGLEQLRDHERLSAWLITVTRRQTWRYVMKRKREAPAEEADLSEGRPGGPEIASPLNLIEQWEQQHQVRQALGELGARCRELLTLLYYTATEPSYLEIAKQLDLPVGSIGPTRARCLQKLRQVLER